MNTYENLQLYSFFIQDRARKIILIFDENSEMTTVTARHTANVGFPPPPPNSNIEDISDCIAAFSLGKNTLRSRNTKQSQNSET